MTDGHALHAGRVLAVDAVERDGLAGVTAARDGAFPLHDVVQRQLLHLLQRDDDVVGGGGSVKVNVGARLAHGVVTVHAPDVHSRAFSSYC